MGLCVVRWCRQVVHVLLQRSQVQLSAHILCLLLFSLCLISSSTQIKVTRPNNTFKKKRKRNVEETKQDKSS